MAWEACIIPHNTVCHFSQQIQDRLYPSLSIHICWPSDLCLPYLFALLFVCAPPHYFFILYLQHWVIFIFFNFSWIADSHVALKAWELIFQGDKEKLDPWDQGGYHETRKWTNIELHVVLALKQKYPSVDPSPPTDTNLFIKSSTEGGLQSPHVVHPQLSS